VVFARPCCCYGGPLLGMGLAVARDCVPPSFHLCLPCDACISGDYQGVFQGSFGWFGLFGPGAARAPKVELFVSFSFLLGINIYIIRAILSFKVAINLKLHRDNEEGSNWLG